MGFGFVLVATEIRCGEGITEEKVKSGSYVLYKAGHCLMQRSWRWSELNEWDKSRSLTHFNWAVCNYKQLLRFIFSLSYTNSAPGQ